ncbi:MAG: TonB-dependent receptor [Bacteroidetes bacterium]|nr:TonB-dependent receptor [Bacteroidota bacterium]
MTDGGNQNVSSILTAGRDPFNSAAAYNFGVLRFRIRGYESDLFGTYINGISMDNLDNGFTPFALWGGLNDVTRNKDLSIGLKPNTFAYGDIGNTTNMDVRAIKQRKQTEIGYAFSNRNYTHKFDITHSTGINKNGWAFSFSASRRYADEAYFPGTSYDGWSYFAAVDKRINQNHLLSLVVFGAPTKVGRQGTATKEAYDLVGTDYNPNWGWQNGKKRNAAMTRTNQPVAILTHDWRINNNTNVLSAVSFSKGDRGSSALDWYKGDNPSPLYYRYLPSYWGDPIIKDQITKGWQTDDNVRQINWSKLYDANMSHIDTFNGVIGRRATYLQGEYVTNSTRFNINSVLNTRIGDHTEFTMGASFQYQKNNNYKKIIDLLGADYFVDLNQFAERFNPTSSTVGQANLNNPNRIAKVGDDYSYNYDIVIGRGAAWLQALMKYDRVDYYVALELSGTSFYRNGKFKNGLFPFSSLGKSVKQEFLNYAFKTGFTFKLDGRNYFFGNMSVLTKAPFFDNVYLSPRVRSTTQATVKSEGVNTIEAGYTLNAPKLKVRLTGYYTEFKNQMNVLTFFHDTYLNLVNYGITGINKTHSGGELGIEAKVMPNVTVNAAAAVGRYYYTSNQNSVTTIDNDASIVSEDLVYAKGYYVGGTPQQAYSFGATYRSPKFWSVSLTYNYFDEIYAEVNPLRRTEKAVQGYALDDPMRKTILDQTRLQSQSTLDLYASYSLKLPKSLNINNKNTFLAFSLGASNILNNKSIIPFLFEQLRFDPTELDKFPSRFNYNYGANYSASIALRF